MFRGLVYKQARVVALIAVMVGLFSAVIELSADLRTEREIVTATTQQFLSMVNGSAAEAAFQMNPELSQSLVGGLFQYKAVRSATMRDNFGNVMGHQERPAAESALAGLAQYLFADSTNFSLRLTHKVPSGGDEVVGELSVTLDPVTVAGGFFSRAGLSLGATALRIVSICLLIVIAFTMMVIRPLLRLTADIRRIDPVHPGHAPLVVPQSNQNDELGQVVRSMNSLLTAFQTGLDARDKAQADLTELARTLEQRVVDRTQELAREKEGVERALTQLNAAHAELNKVNLHINESIRYASRIQTSLLPDDKSLDGMLHDMAVGWAPRDVVGGDFYWIGRFGNRCLIAVMDCTGHGVPGAFMTAIVASVLDRILHEHCHDNPAIILQLLNRLVKASLRQDQGDGPVDMMASDDGLDAAVCLIDQARETLTYAGANIPLIYTHNNELREIRGDRHSLGYRTSQTDFAFTNHLLSMEPGGSFYLATDGVTDQVGGTTRRLFGRRRLMQSMEGGLALPMQEQMERVFAILAAYRGDEPRRDDMAFIGFTPIAPVIASTGEPQVA